MSSFLPCLTNLITALTGVRTFVRRESGATMAEYALLIAVIALVAVAGAKALGAVWDLTQFFDYVVSTR